jgi:6-phosphogluconolactonase
MNIEIFDNADVVAEKAAAFIAGSARRAIADRGRFLLAVSGGSTPWKMLRALSSMDLPWGNIHIFQVDERVAPEGHPDRNLTHLLQSLAHATIPPGNIHPMPVEEADLQKSARRYASLLEQFAGKPAVFDLIHLGLGADGHCASLVPGDPVLDIENTDVALAGPYQGRHRMTLTYPVIDRARRILWIVAGEEKSGMLSRLVKGDGSIPAGRVEQANATILTDLSAAQEIQ